MTNFEKYKEEIMKEDRNGNLTTWIADKVEGFEHISNLHLRTIIFLNWLNEEYKELQTDWSKVERGTLIEVSVNGKDWIKRNFYKYDENLISPIITTWGEKGLVYSYGYARLIKGDNND